MTVVWTYRSAGALHLLGDRLVGHTVVVLLEASRHLPRLDKGGQCER